MCILVCLGGGEGLGEGKEFPTCVSVIITNCQFVLSAFITDSEMVVVSITTLPFEVLHIDS